jgi:hypothetical protein
MTPEETVTLVRVAAIAHDRTVPDGMAEVWHFTLGDLPFGLAREALVELLRTSPYWPKPADVRERARMVKATQDREVGKQRQIEGRAWTPSKTPRTGAGFTAHILGRLRDAGQDPNDGVWLGKERAGTVAVEAGREWLAKTSPEGEPDPLLTRFLHGYANDQRPEPQERACSRCYRPTTSPDLCDRCQPGGTT